MGWRAQAPLDMKKLFHTSLPVFVADTREVADLSVAAEIVGLLAAGETVLALPTGRTPVGIYRELIHAYRARKASFARATTFNLDEFLGVAPDHPAGFARWMEEQLFAHVDLDRARARLPRLENADEDRAAAARAYEAAIEAAGGIDLLVLGIGRNGHIGFNEPGSARTSRTRVVDLAPETRADAAAAFGGIEHVPTQAISMGVATILDARRIRVLAFGAHKSDVVRRMLIDPPSEDCPSTFLRGHPDVKLFLDREAAAGLDAR